jgi:WD40 repeat protein
MLVVFLLGAVLAALAPAFSAAEQPLTVGAPAVVAELRGSQLKGNPSQLTWSPDGKMLCLITLEGDANSKSHAYSITLDSRSVQGLDAAPDWAAKYWEWKSARTPPGRRELVIQVETSTKPGSLPTQSLSDKAKGGMMENAVAAQNDAGAMTRTLTLKGEAIGTYVNQPLVPGVTFGWSPESLHAVAFAKPDGHLALLDFDAGRIEIDNTKAVLLPAWSPDGSTVAYLQKTGRRDYVVSTVSVTRP